MMRQELNREEAEREKRLFVPMWFCPLINGTCVAGCTFYREPYFSRFRTTSKNDKGEPIEYTEWNCEPGFCRLGKIAEDVCYKFKKEEKEEGDEC